MTSRCAILGLALLACAGLARAEMHALDDDQLSDIQGGALGIVLDGLLVDGKQANLTLNGINNSSGQNVAVGVDDLYIANIGSKLGSTLAPAQIGSLDYPLKLSLAKGSAISTVLVSDGRTVKTLPDNISLLDFEFPALLATSNSAGQPCIVGSSAGAVNCSSRQTGRVDLGASLSFQVTATRKDFMRLNLSELTMDGSYLRLWSDPTSKQLSGEFRLNLFAKSMQITTCEQGKTGCTTAANLAANSIYLTNAYASVALGYGKAQPMRLQVQSDGNFTFTLPAITNANAADFYANAPRTSIVIDNLNVGGTAPTAPGVNPTGGVNLGRSVIDGLGIGYLRLTTHNL
ncbi:hypothetical protein [Pseudomonas citronellolis]|uniref:hypothetical protein n=1 Tax=Pseudomonas citronellolis TaxID=53408 RepID=UPI0023E3BA16|nr:hypothetical protein [Pseudomonas citronellolis]MDF3934057.1 hypothetical protein [Pseudomonas citronellolis]